MWLQRRMPGGESLSCQNEMIFTVISWLNRALKMPMLLKMEFLGTPLYL